MDKNKQYEVMSVTNITGYDFPYFNMAEINKKIREQRKVGADQSERTYEKPEVPTLMWDGECYALKAGETRQFPRFMAMNFGKKIVDRAIIEKTNLPGIKNNGGAKSLGQVGLRKEIENLVIGKVASPEAPEAPQEEEVALESTNEKEEALEASKGEGAQQYADMGRSELMKLAKERGIKFTNKVKKEELISLLNET